MEFAALAIVLLLSSPQSTVSFDERILATVEEDVTADKVVFSGDGRSVAYRGLKAGKYAVWTNKAKGADYTAVDVLQFTGDHRAAYKASNGGSWSVIVGGSPSGSPLPVIGPPVFSPDGKKVAFVGSRGQGGAQDAKAWAVFVGGSKGLDYASCGQPVWSADGSTVAHTVRIGKAGTATRAFHTAHAVVIAGQAGPEYEECGSPVFAPKGKRVAYKARNDYTWTMVVDAKPEPGWTTIADPIWSPDGKRLSYRASSKPNVWHVVIDGNKGPEFEAIGGDPVWSADSKDVAFVARKGAEAFIVSGKDRKSEMFPECSLPGWSPDGSTIAFSAKGKRWMMVVGDKRGMDDLETVGVPVFSPDSKQVAYTAMWKFKPIVVINDGKGTQFDAVKTPVWSLDSTKVAYAAQQGAKWIMVVKYRHSLPFDEIYTPPYWNADGSKVAFGVRAGNDLIWKVLPGE